MKHTHTYYSYLIYDMSVSDGNLLNSRISEMVFTTSWEYSTGSLKGWENILVFFIPCAKESNVNDMSRSKSIWEYISNSSNDFYLKCLTICKNLVPSLIYYMIMRLFIWIAYNGHKAIELLAVLHPLSSITEIRSLPIIPWRIYLKV